MTLPRSRAAARRELAAALEQQRVLALQLVAGLPDLEDRRRFVDLLLARMLTLAFLQSHGLLDGDREYLRARLARTRTTYGPGHAYQRLLRPLWFEGLGRPAAERPADRHALLGDLPHLRSALFRPHPLELRAGMALDLPDTLAERLVDFVGTWRWRLGEHHSDPHANDTEALSDLLEQALDRKRTGSYYTPGDVTAYICDSTLIPALFERAGLSPAGLDLQQTAARYLRAPADTPLAGETERERAHRLARRDQTLASARSGAIATWNDALTAHLDLSAMARDLIAALDPAEALRLVGALDQLRVLDPTCGTGAFLLAALRTLAPLYMAVLDRLAALEPVHVGDRAGIRAILAEVARAPNQAAFVSQRIAGRNLFGVDLLDDAAEICRLRLTLRMAADLTLPAQLDTLPDLSGNIRTGNALVGYLEAGGAALLPGADLLPGASEQALDRSIAALLGIDISELAGYERWHRQHRPLHWPLAFPEVLAGGGFDAVIGNPPYVSAAGQGDMYAALGYRTARCGNLYALTIERSLALLREGGRCGLIVPIASVSTGAMAALQALYGDMPQWHSHYAVRPGKLFPGVDMNLTISLLQRCQAPAQRYTTGYRRWSNGAAGERAQLFAALAYTPLPELPGLATRFPKIGSALEADLLRQMLAHRRQLGDYAASGGARIYYHSGGRYWRKALSEKRSSHYKALAVQPAYAPVALALLNSQLFYWYWIACSNCMDVVAREVLGLPVFALEQADAAAYHALTGELLAAYAGAQTTRSRRGGRIQVEELNIAAAMAKPVIDLIDRQLAADYGLSAEQIDFVLHYDLKFRVREMTEIHS